LYYTAGNVWETRAAISAADLVHGIGAGVQWDTPIGPARFTAGKAFITSDDQSYRDYSDLRFTETLLYFSLGHEF